MIPATIQEYFLPENKKVYILLECINQVDNRIEFRLFRVLFWKIYAVSNEVSAFISSDKYAGNVISTFELNKQYMKVIQHQIFTELSDDFMKYKVSELAIEYKELPVDLYYYMDDICYAYSVVEKE